MWKKYDNDGHELFRIDIKIIHNIWNYMRMPVIA
jgi:hypothetical protein